MNTITDNRPSPIAGQWYAGNAKTLAANVDGYLEAASLPEIQGSTIAVIAPHAGHVYSGPVAGYAFAAVKGMKPDLVVIISPMHHPYYDPLLTSDHGAYETPLGSIPIDRKAVQELDTNLEGKLGFGMVPVRKDREHSLEIELPFLQRALVGDFSLLPVMVRDQSQQVIQSLGSSLAEVLKTRSALLVASTSIPKT